MAVKKSVHTPEEIHAVIEELNAQTDRGAAIIAASVAEELLAVVIQERLRPLNSEIRQALFERPNSPLSSFSAKIDLGFALGLFSESARKNLHILRECRNRFAHRIEALNFDHPDIVEVLKNVLSKNSAFYGPSTTNRDRFLGIFAVIAMVLIAQCGEDIRVEMIGDTRPQIFGELLARLYPEQEARIRAALNLPLRSE